MRKNEIFGMNTKDINTLKKIMNPPEGMASEAKTVKQAIEDGDAKVVQRRTSKRGVELVKLDNGKEYEEAKLDSTTYFA